MRKFETIYRKAEVNNSLSFKEAYNSFINEIIDDIHFKDDKDMQKFDYLKLSDRGWAQQLDLNRNTHGWTVKRFLRKVYDKHTPN